MANRTPTQQYDFRSFAEMLANFIFVCDNGAALTGGVLASTMAAYFNSQATFNRQAGNYTATLEDLYTVTILSTDASASTVTLPGYGTGSGEVEWPDGALIKGIQHGAGTVTIAVSGGSTTLQTAHGSFETAAQYSVWSAMYDATDNQWILFGDL